MRTEYLDGSGKIENLFGKPGFAILTPDEILQNTVLVTKDNVTNIHPETKIELDRGKTNFNFLLTGLPRWGKTTAATIVELETKAFNFPLNVVRDNSFAEKAYDLKLDDHGAFSYNLGYAVNGLAELIKNSAAKFPQVNLYERGFIDHFVFAESLTKWQNSDKSYYKKYIEGFKTLFAFYLDRIDGIIVCNSSAERSIERGSQTPKELLKLLSDGYRKFPASLSVFYRGGNIDPKVIINLDFDELDEPVQTLKRAIYTMFYWNLSERIEVND